MAGEEGARLGSPSVWPLPSPALCGDGQGAISGLTLSPPGLKGLPQGGRVEWE